MCKDLAIEITDNDAFLIAGSKENNILQFSSISIREDYRKKWNIHQSDFICLTKNGKLVRDTLYRIGGLGRPKLDKDEYFMILKHVEAFYDDSITKDPKRKPHLDGRWCILDKNGNEKIEIDGHKSPYLVSNSQIYSVNRHYYNVETREFYCDAHTSMESTDYLFLENRYDKDVSKRGVMKINKKNGTWELFS
jgi:hypothetical protein